MGPVGQSVALHQAGNACQGQTLELIGTIYYYAQFFQACIIAIIKAYLREDLKGRSLALHANIRLARKNQPITNTVSYFGQTVSEQGESLRALDNFKTLLGKADLMQKVVNWCIDSQHNDTQHKGLI